MPLKLFTKEVIPKKCPHCRKELGDALKCRYCSKLLDDVVAKLKESSRDRIYGNIFCYVFSPDKSKIAFVTCNAGSKNPAFYLYDMKHQKIIWTNNDHFAVRRMFYLEDRIIIVSRSSGISSLGSFNAANGKMVAKIDKAEFWTNMLQFKNDFLIGFRDSFLYKYNKDLEIVNTICLKEDEEDCYCDPVNIVTNLTEDKIAFSRQRILFLVDSEFNILWAKDVGGEYFEFRRTEPFGKNLTYTQQKYIWAFNLLEIKQESDSEQVRRAFRNKAMQWHPDRHPEENKGIAETKFKEIVQAYELIAKNDESAIGEELYDMGFSRRSAVFDFDDSAISEINFWQQEETGKTVLEVKMSRGTDKFLDLEGKAISDKIEVDLIKVNRTKHTEKSYDSSGVYRELSWTLRDGGFWFKPMGVKLYQDIKDGYFLIYDQEKAKEFLNSLDSKIDVWDIFISEKLNEVNISNKFNNLKSSVAGRDKNRCVMCGNKRNAHLHNIFSLSEHMANYISESHSDIAELKVEEIRSFYDEKNNLTLCPKCYFEEYEDGQIEHHLMFLGAEWPIFPIKKDEYFNLAGIENKICSKLRICTKSNPKEWFLTQFNEIEKLEKEIASSYHGRLISGEHRTTKIQLFFRIGKYELAKRWAMRHQRFLITVCNEMKPQNLGCEKNSFTAMNWDKIVNKVLDKMIELHENGNYKLQYDWGYPKYGLKKYRKFFCEAEKEVILETSV